MIKIRGVYLQSINYILTTLLSKLLWQVWNKLPIVTMQVDDGNRLAYRLFVRSCYELLVSQLVNNLLRENDIWFVGSTCCESVGLINLVKKKRVTITCFRDWHNWEQAVRTHLVDKLWGFSLSFAGNFSQFPHCTEITIIEITMHIH